MGEKNPISSAPGDIPQTPVVPARSSRPLGKMSPSFPAPWREMRGEREWAQHHLLLLLSFLASEGSACHLNSLLQLFKN